MANQFSLQKILWNIAGAEISVLENCRTDHKRFGAIGATISMTTFIAFLSGTSAAWYFTQRGSDTAGSIGWAIAFGVVWACLIFCIDRSLVITLKKNPERKSKYWWAVPLGSRALLAGIIAFMVSIPLELVVFEDFIKEQQYFWNENKSNALSQNSRANRLSLEAQNQIEEGNSSLNRLEGQKTILLEEKENIQSRISNEETKLNNPTTLEYKDANRRYNQAISTANTLQRKLSNLQQQYNSDTLNRPSIRNQMSSVQAYLKEQNRVRASCKEVMESEIEKWNKPIKQKIEELKIMVAQKEKEIDHKGKNIDATQNLISEAQYRRTQFEQQRDSLVDEHGKTMHEGNHFIQNFEILEYAVGRQLIDCDRCKGSGKINNEKCYHCRGDGKIMSDLPTEWYFLWLIRLLFFIIELLPTVVKIVMPMGAYDRMVYAEEKDMEYYLNSSSYLERIRNMHDMEIKAHEDQLAEQKALETEIRAKLMQELKEAQIEIAETAVRKWRETELLKLEVEGLDKLSEKTDIG